MKQVVVVSEDAGSARALAAAIQRFEQRGHRIHFILGEVASRCLGEVGLAQNARPIAHEEEVEPALSLFNSLGPAVVVTGTSCWGLRLEARAVIAARRLSLPSVTMIDFPSQYLARLSYPGLDDLGAVADRLAVMDPVMQQELEKIGIAAARMVVTGSPIFDPLLDGAARRRLPLAAPAGVVLFLSQPISVLWGPAGAPSHLGYTEHTVLSTLAPLVIEKGLRLVVRPHPREDVGELTSFVRGLPGGATVETAGTLADAVAQAAMVIGMTTIGLIEAALLGRPAISAQLGRIVPDSLPSNSIELTAGVEDVAGLRAAMDRALQDPPPPERIFALAAKMGWHPGATDRLEAAVESLAPPGAR